MRTALLLLTLSCAHRRTGSEADLAAEPALAAATPVDETPSASPGRPPEWLMTVLPALQSQDIATALHVLDETLDRTDLTPQERTLALWYRAAARAWAGDRGGEILDLRAFVSASAQIQLQGDAVGAQLKHRVELAQLAVLADDALTDRSIGASIARAIPLTLASDEQFFLGRLACGSDGSGSYKVVGEALLHEGSIPIEQIDLECETDHSRRMVYFDLTDWFDLLRFGLGAAPPPAGLTEEGARTLLEIGQEQAQEQEQGG